MQNLQTALFRVETPENGLIIMKMLWKIMHGISVEDAGNAFLLNQASSPVHRKPPFSTSPHGSEDEASIDG